MVEVADLVFWTCALDFKYKNVQVREDKAIDVCLFYGRIRNSENEAIAKLLLQKSEVMVAFGSYVCFGCIPDLANFTNQIINYFLSTQLLQVIKVSM